MGRSACAFRLWIASAGGSAPGVGEYPLHRKRDDPDYATQSHADHMRALAEAMREALARRKPACRAIEWALAIDTTGSSIIPVDENLQPLDDYYLWCDHRAWREAALITETAHRAGLAAIEWCGGVYSSEWGFSKLLHWLRHNPDKRGAVLHGAGTLRYGRGHAVRHHAIRARRRARICAMGHKWMWNAALGGLPPEEFLVEVDPLLKGVRERLAGRYATSDQIAGQALRRVGRQAGAARGHPDSGGRVRRALGRHRRGRAGGRRGERRGHLHLHHGDRAFGRV